VDDSGILKLPLIGQRRSLHRAWHAAASRLREGRILPERLALSAGIGVFIGLLPLPGLQTFVWLGFVAIFPIDPLITYACTWVSNPLTVLAFTVLELKLGALVVTQRSLAADLVNGLTLRGALRLGHHLMVGGVILSAACGLIAYSVAYIIARRFAKARID